jgi:hypothetical protein
MDEKGLAHLVTAGSEGVGVEEAAVCRNVLRAAVAEGEGELDGSGLLRLLRPAVAAATRRAAGLGFRLSECRPATTRVTMARVRQGGEEDEAWASEHEWERRPAC